MSRYLDRLRELDSEIRPPWEPSKPAKAPFDGFAGSEAGRFSEIAPVAGPDIHRCGCGAVGVIGISWFVREPSRARWYCSSCYSSEEP
jgi:hypothetical protein